MRTKGASGRRGGGRGGRARRGQAAGTRARGVQCGRLGRGWVRRARDEGGHAPFEHFGGREFGNPLHNSTWQVSADATRRADVHVANPRERMASADTAEAALVRAAKQARRVPSTGPRALDALARLYRAAPAPAFRALVLRAALALPPSALGGDAAASLAREAADDRCDECRELAGELIWLHARAQPADADADASFARLCALVVDPCVAVRRRACVLLASMPRVAAWRVAGALHKERPGRAALEASALSASATTSGGDVEVGGSTSVRASGGGRGARQLDPAQRVGRGGRGGRGAHTGSAADGSAGADGCFSAQGEGGPDEALEEAAAGALVSALEDENAEARREIRRDAPPRWRA